jgi:hypothetical protein
MIQPMGNPSRYWIFYRLDPSGGWQSLTPAITQTHFHTTFPQFVRDTDPPDKPIQIELITTFRSGQSEAAGLCLRCFISQETLQVCQALVQKFGAYYGFHLDEILRIVLDDDGQIPLRPYPSVARKALHSFDPDRASLATWTNRLVRQHDDLNTHLLQYGLYLISDWAILNDTRVAQLPPILTAFHHISASDLEQATALLASYRAVYLRDRQQQRPKGRCQPPTPEQLQEMAHILQREIPDKVLLKQLEQLARYIREYRIAIKNGKLRQQSIDDPDVQDQIEYRYLQGIDPNDQREAKEKFLANYETEFEMALDQALAQVITHRLSMIKKPVKQQQFLTALQLYYQQRLSMTAIATQLNLRGQDVVTKLLQLKKFRADVKRHMLLTLQTYVLEQAKAMLTPEQLDAIVEQVETALLEQVEALMLEEQRQSTTPSYFKTQSRFARQLCVCLEHITL